MKLLICFVVVCFFLLRPAAAQIGLPFANTAERNGFALGELNEEQSLAYQRLDTTNAECLLIRGIYEYTNSSYAAAIRSLDRSIRIFPMAEAYYYRANCKRVLKDSVGEAFDNNQAIVLDSAFKDHIRYTYQMEHMQAAQVASSYFGDYPKAITEYTQAIELAPDYGQAYYFRGLVREQTGDSIGAEKDFAEAVRLDDKMGIRLEEHRVDQMYSVVYNNLDDENLETALAWCDLIIARSPSAKAYYTKATLLDRVSDSTGAEAAFQKSIELDTSYSDFLRQFRIVKLSESAKAANSYFELEQAVADYTKALAMDSSYSWLWHDRGHVKARMNDLEGALSDYEQAYARDPLNADVIISIGSLEMNNGNYAEAVAAFDRATAYGVRFYHCPFYRVYELRGMAKELNQDYEGAIEDYTMLMSYDYTDYDLYLRRGRLYAKLNRMQEACNDFAEARKIWKGAAREEIAKYCE